MILGPGWINFCGTLKSGRVAGYLFQLAAALKCRKNRVKMGCYNRLIYRYFILQKSCRKKQYFIRVCRDELVKRKKKIPLWARQEAAKRDFCGGLGKSRNRLPYWGHNQRSPPGLGGALGMYVGVVSHLELWINLAWFAPHPRILLDLSLSARALPKSLTSRTFHQP